MYSGSTRADGTDGPPDAEHDGEMASLGIVPASRLGLMGSAIPAQHFTETAKQNPEAVEVLVLRFGKDTDTMPF